MSDRKLTKPIANTTTHVLLITAIIVVALVVLFNNPEITGRYFAPAEDFSANISEKFSSNSNYSFEIPQEQPYNLKSLKLSGSFSGEGSARVFLKTENETFLVFDSNNLATEPETIADLVTGALTEADKAAKEEAKEDKKEEKNSNKDSSSSDTTNADVGSSGESSDSQESAEPASPPSSEPSDAQEGSVPADTTTDQGEAGADNSAPAEEQPAEEAPPVEQPVNETQPIEIPEEENITAEGNVSEVINGTEEQNITEEIPLNETLVNETKELTFSNECEEACLLPDGLADSSYTLEIEIENGELSISEISYSLQNLTDIPVNITVEIVDSKGEPVAANITLVDDAGESVASEDTSQQTIANEIFAPPTNEISTEGTESFETAPSDENNLVVDITETGIPIQSIEFENIDATTDINAVIGIDDVPETDSSFVEVYAIDPTQVNFTEATVTVTATGSALYKCASWDFANQTCTDGNWTFVQAITPGQPYEITLTANDPAFGETGAAPTVQFVSPTPADGNTTTNNYVYVNASSTDESGHHYALLNWNSTLVGWWRLEETSGTSFADDSGRSNTGSCTNCPTYNSSGVFNGSYNFDSASSQYIQATYNEDFNFTEQMTIALWFKYRNSQSAGLVSNRAASSSSYNLYISTTNLIFDVANATTHKATSAYPISTDTWYHAVGVYNGSSINLYINGTLVRTQAQTGDVQDQSFNILIGRYQASYLNGSIDDVMMFRRALSDSEVLALYNATANQYYNNFTNLSYGNYTFKAYAVDTAGNKVDTGTRTVTLQADSTPPTINFVDPTPPDGNVTGNNYIPFAVSTSDANQHYSFVNFDNSNSLFYKMNETSGNLVDYSGYGHDAVNQGSATYQQTGKFGKAIDFDGSSSWFRLSKDTINFTNENFTVSFWIYPDSWPATWVPLGEGTIVSYNTSFLFYGTSLGPLTFYAGNSTCTGWAVDGLALGMQGTPAINAWTLITVTKEGANYTYYANGTAKKSVIAASNSVCSNTAGYNMTIGASRTGISKINGTMDEVLIFNRSLSASEVYVLYNSGSYSGNITNLADGAHSFYAFAKDTSGNENQASTRTVTISTDLTPPATVTNLANQSRSQTWIYWNWTNPADADFSQAVIYLNGSNVANTSNNYYNATSLQNFTDYTITVHTKDTTGNINNTDVNSTAKTLSYNNVPVSTTPAITPATAYTNDDLNCTFTITDGDAGDTLTANYTWYNNSVVIITGTMNVVNGTANSIILDDGNTTKTEIWNCSVIPYDGNEYGTAKSAIKTIANSLPTAPVVDVIPDVPTDDDDLLATIATASTDADNDTIAYAYQWYKDDIGKAGQTSNTLSHLLTEVGDVWKCIVTPNDGTANGATGQDNVTISALPDTTAPVITISSPANNSQLTAGTTSTAIGITTNENAICRYNLTNSTFAYADGTNFTNTNSTSHNFTLAGLADGTSYTLYYKCNDTAGNVNNASTTHLFSVASPSGGGNNGGNGGGGGGGGEGVITASGQCPLDTPVSLAFSFGDSYACLYYEVAHSIRLSGIINDAIELTIASDPVKAQFKTGETKLFDLDGDGVSDLEITVLSQANSTVNLRATFFGKVVTEVPTTVTTPAGLEIPASPPEPLTAAAVQVKPYKAPNPAYAVPTFLLLILLFTILAIRKENLSERVKKMLTALHLALIATIVALLVFTFVKTPLTGATIAVSAIKTTIPANKLIIGVSALLASLTIFVLVWLLHLRSHSGRKIRL